MAKNKKKIDPYIIYLNKSLGEGTYGKVYQAFDTKLQQKRAIKVIAKEKLRGNAYLENAIKREYQMMLKVSSPWTVKCYEMVQTSNNYYIVSELCPNGCFRKILDDNPKGIKTQQAFIYIKQLLKSFLVLVQKGIIHRDLKPENILLNHQNSLKLCDFGFAKISEHLKMFQTCAGTPVYMSPQVLNRQQYSEKCDIFSLGVLMYEILYGKRPIPDGIASAQQLGQWYLTNKIEYPHLQNTQNKQLSNSLIEITKKCLSIQQINRFSWEQLYHCQIFHTQFFHLKQSLKVGFILSELRMSIHEQNIDVMSLVKQYKRTKLNDLQFLAFMQVLHENIKQEDVNYFMRIYGQFDMQVGQQYIDIKSLLQTFKKAGICLQSLDYQQAYVQNNILQEKRLNEQHQMIGKTYPNIASFVDPVTSSENPQNKPKPTIKCCAAIRLLRKNIIDAKVDLCQFFDMELQNYKRKGKQLINPEEFEKLLRLIYPYFQRDQTDRIFKIIDIQNKGMLIVDSLCKTFSIIAGKPFRRSLIEKTLNKQ